MVPGGRAEAPGKEKKALETAGSVVSVVFTFIKPAED